MELFPFDKIRKAGGHSTNPHERHDGMANPHNASDGLKGVLVIVGILLAEPKEVDIGGKVLQELWQSFSDELCQAKFHQGKKQLKRVSLLQDSLLLAH